MAKTPGIIRTEHRRLASVIACMQGVIEDTLAGRIVPDAALFDTVLQYFETFLYRFHHPKEDEFLFPCLRGKSPAIAEVLDRLDEEHSSGAKMIKALRQALEKFKLSRDPADFAEFARQATLYRDFEWKHMSTEEKHVLPLAEKLLTEEDWMPLDAAFTDHEDPLFGDKPAEQFSRLMRDIVNRAPAPHGLGG
ncbi:MAG: hemerythrin domain-containing protein [Gammaproteobacteria bacterium]|nr:hemerythrin domain-containing protein [Gammaproteobacteria bacterium]